MANLRVLIADEDLDSRVSIKRAIARAGLELVGETGYGTEAISLALEMRPDVIFLAVEEPSTRALDTADGLGNTLSDTPVVAYSSDGGADAVRRAMIAGAREYVVKPVESGRLGEAVRVALNVEERRQMRRAGQLTAPVARGMVITVAGAKGGIGKSVVAVNLSVALRTETGRSVVIIDADTQFGDVATMFDVMPQRTVHDLLSSRQALDRTNIRDFVTTHAATGVDVVAASEEEGTWDDIDAESIRLVLDAFSQVYDFVVVDTSGSLDRLVHSCIDNSTLTLVVSSGEVSAVRDTAAAIRRIERWGVDEDRVRYVLNARTAEHAINADDLGQAIGRSIFWTVPHDRAVVESVQVGYPLVLRGPDTRAGQSIAALARRISGRQSTGTESERAPIWRRVLPMRPSASKGVAGNDSDVEQLAPTNGRRVE